MYRLGFVSVLALVGALVTAHAAAADIVYSGSASFGGGVVTIDVTTDGTIGPLAENDINQFTLMTSFGGTTTQTLSNDPGIYHQYPVPGELRATATDLYFDFSNPNALLVFGSHATGARLCLGGVYYSCGTGTAPGASFTDGQSVAIQSLSTEVSIASATPEPAVWALMMVGVGGMGAVLRTRRRTRAA